MSACSDFSTSDTLFDVGRSDACAVGRSGEAPYWRTISFIGSPSPSINTMAAWFNGRRWRWEYSRDASRSARVSPRVLSGISMYSSCATSGLMRGGIGVVQFSIGVGGGGVVNAGVGAGAGAGVRVGAGARANGTGTGAGAARMGTCVGIGT